MRLTQTMRDIILNRALKAKRDELKTDKEASAQMQEGVIRKIFPGLDKIGRYIEKNLDKKYPVGKEGSVVYVCDARGYKHRLIFKSPVSTHNYQSIAWADINEKGRLAVVELSKVLENIETEKEEVEKLRKEISCILHSVTTIKRLSEVWPEGAEFYTGFKENCVALMDRKTIESVNKKLGLVK